jgi:hypothetical protein
MRAGLDATMLACRLRKKKNVMHISSSNEVAKVADHHTDFVPQERDLDSRSRRTGSRSLRNRCVMRAETVTDRLG